MINMMYIVLTALLALNVSKQVLKSFHMMEQGFISSAFKLDDKNESIMRAFATSMETDAKKTEPYLARAKKAREISTNFCQYIDQVKSEVETLGGGRKDMDQGDLVGEISKADEMEKHANYFVNEKKGLELQRTINKTREELLALLKPGKDLNLKERYFKESEAAAQLKAVDPISKEEDKKTWVNLYLEENPIAGVLAMLTKIKNDAKNLETDVLSKLQEGVYIDDIPINTIKAMVIPRSNYVMKGAPYEAEILLVASNSTSENRILVNGQEIEVAKGKGQYSTINNEVGAKAFSGSIMVKGKDGVEKPYNFNSVYQVYQPLATISAENMNIVYSGLDNPIAISVPGFPASAITATVTGGWSLSKSSNGKYKVKGAANTREITITASVKTENGTKVMGKQEYTVRRVPLPRIKYGTLDGSRSVTKGTITGQNRIIASLGNFYFKGVKYKVTGYTAVLYSKRNGSKTFTINGSSTATLRSEINRLRSGDNVIVTKVRIKGPDGSLTVAGVPLTIR